MKSLPMSFVDELAMRFDLAWHARSFFGRPAAHVDYRDGTVYNGHTWADEDETAEFYRHLQEVAS